MSTISSQEIISIIKSEIENFDMHAGQEQETGSVIWVGDGIAIVYGIEHAMYGEIVIFENGVKGMVQDIRKNEIGCILDVYKRQPRGPPACTRRAGIWNRGHTASRPLPPAAGITPCIMM